MTLENDFSRSGNNKGSNWSGKFEGLDESEKNLGIPKFNVYGNLQDIPLFRFKENEKYVTKGLKQSEGRKDLASEKKSPCCVNYITGQYLDVLYRTEC